MREVQTKTLLAKTQQHYREVLTEPSLRREGEEVIHVFERAGLGRAPFSLIDVYLAQGLHSCDYCGTQITEICTIKSADHRIFKVGNQCVMKTGDRGLIDPIKRELNHLRSQARKEKNRIRIEAAKVLLNDARIRASLGAQPHPTAYYAEQGRDLLSYVCWLIDNGGDAGRVRAAKMIEQAAKAAPILEVEPEFEPPY